MSEARHAHPPAIADHRILVPVASAAEADTLLPLAHMLARSQPLGQIVTLLVVTVPRGEDASQAAAAMAELRAQVDEVMRRHNVLPLHVHTLVRPADEVWPAIWEYVELENAHSLLLAWPNQVVPELRHPRLAEPPARVVLVHRAEAAPRWTDVQRILLPVRGGPNEEAALRVAFSIAHARDARITLLHAAGSSPREAERLVVQQFGPILRERPEIHRSIIATEPLEKALPEEARRHQVVILGASSRGDDPTALLNPWMEGLIASLPPVITLIVKAEARPSTPRPARPATREDRARRPSAPLTVLVDQWFAENTFHSREFERLEELVALKEAQGLTISLGLPALNEEATIGNIIRTIRKALMEEVPLLDEMVLIDSGSVDYTREIAADLGIPVYIHQQILPKYGAYHGKGEALWKSLYVLKGDIIVWIDTDIRNIHPRFVYGLLGPLLRNPRIQYVKGFYRRPLKQGERIIAGGGGRVTELTARPLLNLFFPELSGLIQPLSGEYAGRRQALERLPFFTGYGVETGLLIDFLEHFGLGAIAQVDLLERIHRNQSLQNLSKMAFAIIQVVIRRLEDRHKIKLMEDINKRMNLIRYEMGRYWLEPQEIHERERPPMITVPEYRAKFARRAPGETA